MGTYDYSKLKRRLQTGQVIPNMKIFGDLVDSLQAKINVAGQSGSVWEALGDFDPAGDIDMSSSGEYNTTPQDPYPQTDNITFNFANVENGSERIVSIKSDATHTFTLGTNSNTVTSPVGFTDGGTLAAGVWDFIFTAKNGKVSVRTLQTAAGDIDGPTISSLDLAADNTTITVNLSEAGYSTPNGSGDLAANDFVPTIEGGVATNPVLSNPVMSSGADSVTFDLAYTGEADGNETLKLTVADGNSIYDEHGNAMSAGENGSVAMNAAAFVPSDLGSSKLRFWGEDARVLANTVNDGTNVQRWYDTSGNAKHFNQFGATSLQPFYSATRGILFDGTDQYMQCNQTGSGETEIFMVVQCDTYVNQEQLLEFLPGHFNGWLREYNGAAGNYSFEVRNSNDNTYVTLSALGDLNGQKIFIRARINGASSSLNKEPGAKTASGTMTNITWTGLILGTTLAGKVARFSVIEMAVCTGLTAGERTLMNDYFAAI